MAQAQQELQPGEHVAWNYGAGQAKGQVVEKLTENKKIGARVYRASPDDPRYLVKSDASGKEAVKKPETLHKLEDANEGEARRQEVGAKEKRDHYKERSSAEERKEDEAEESSKKVPDTGKGSVRESAKAAERKVKDVVAGDEDAGLMEDVGEERDATYEPKREELAVPDDEEALANLPTDEEALAQAEKETQEEGVKALDEVNMEDDGGEEEDQRYDPLKEEDVGGDAAEDEEVINALPPDEELIKQVEKENKEAALDAARQGGEAGGHAGTATAGKKK